MHFSSRDTLLAAIAHPNFRLRSFRFDTRGLNREAVTRAVSANHTLLCYNSFDENIEEASLPAQYARLVAVSPEVSLCSDSRC